MFFRALVWLAALGGIVALLESDRAPADPVRTNGRGETGRTTLVVARTQLHGIAPAVSNDWDVQQPTRWLMACTATPQQTRELTGLIQALAGAADLTLEEPAQFEINVWTPGQPMSRYGPRDRGFYDSHARIVSGVYPAGNPPLAEMFDYLWTRPRRFLTDGAFVAVGAHTGHVQLTSAWHACHQGRWTSVAFVSTHALNPQMDPGRAEILRRYLRAFVGHIDVQTTSHGLLLTGDEIESGRQLLNDPRLIALAWELSTNHPGRQASIRRAALCDDDPRLAEFAALDQMWHLPLGQEAALELLQWWPHPAHAKTSGDYGPQQVLWFDSLSPEVAAREIQRLARTTVDADQLADAFFHMLSAESPSERSAGHAAFLQRLPVHALEQLDHLVVPLSWPDAERDGFYDALLMRLRVELSQGDSVRGAKVLGEAAALTDMFHLAEHLPAGSRFVDLAAQLLFDEACGNDIQRHAGDVVVEAARERLRHSAPEIRRQACRLLQSHRESLPPGLTGDPYLEDLLAQ